LKFFAVLVVVAAAILLVECNVYFPREIRIMSGEEYNTPKGFAYTLETSSAIETNGNYDATVKLFGVIPVKEVTVNVLPETRLVAGGKAVGIKMFTKGLICVGSQSIKDTEGAHYNIAKALDIKTGDMILTADGVDLHTIEQFSEFIEATKGSPIVLGIDSNGNFKTVSVTPIKTSEGYRLGLWVRDSTAGIGTVTYLGKNQDFAALGHPITDVDTKTLMPIDKGTIGNIEISGVYRGNKGSAGELYGVFSTRDCGVILKNTERGIYGKTIADNQLTYNNEAIPIASANQIKTGRAQIYANVRGNEIEKFDIEIQKLVPFAPDAKNMIIKITDRKLLDITGGIVQGMSGSPVIQNGKLVGAVTHVFVNDPTRGYAIFIENMLSEIKKVS
jgi:stage IV sporulation protein B